MDCFRPVRSQRLIKIINDQINITNIGMNFKQFIAEKISYYVLHFKKKRILLDLNGDLRQQINLSFDYLSNLFLSYAEEQGAQQVGENSLSLGSFDTSEIKITDQDLVQFWEYLDQSYHLGFNVEGQDIGDQTILKLSELYLNKQCAFTKLRLAGNSKITAVGLGKLGQSLQHFPNIEEIDLHGLQIAEGGINRIIELIGVAHLTTVDLGLIGNESLKYLSHILEGNHSIECVSFGQNEHDKWQPQGKNIFQKCIRRSESCKQILALNIYAENLVKHYDMISEMNIICHKNRNLKIQQIQNEFKAATLNPNQNKYYEPDNHSLNAYKFSVKSYLNNVFGSLLDEALYFLEKERRNSLREDAIFNITKEPINKIILEDICTADGSIIVLTKYLLNKIKEKNAHK